MSSDAAKTCSTRGRSWLYIRSNAFGPSSRRSWVNAASDASRAALSSSAVQRGGDFLLFGKDSRAQVSVHSMLCLGVSNAFCQIIRPRWHGRRRLCRTLAHGVEKCAADRFDGVYLNGVANVPEEVAGLPCKPPILRKALQRSAFLPGQATQIMIAR